MISALEIGIALSLPMIVLARILIQAKPKPVRVRAVRQHRRSHD